MDEYADLRNFNCRYSIDLQIQKLMKLLLQHKIVAGYLLLMAVIGCIVAIVLHERKRVAEIEHESVSIFQTQSNISTTHRYITVLATLEESVMMWDDEDFKIVRIANLLSTNKVCFYVRLLFSRIVYPYLFSGFYTVHQPSHAVS